MVGSGAEAVRGAYSHRSGASHKAVLQLTEPDGSQTTVKLGLFIDNARRRADELTSDPRAELDALGMRW